PLQLPILPLQFPKPISLARRQPCSLPGITFGLANPGPQGFGRAVDLRGDRSNRCPLGVVVPLGLHHHPHCSFLDLGGEPLSSLLHCSILSDDGASGKAGAVHLAVERRFGQNVADLPKEVGVGVGRSGAPLLGRGEGQFELRPDPVQRRSSHLELLGHSGHALASVGGRRDGAAQSPDFRQGRGDSVSSALALTLASSSLIVRSPTRTVSLSTSSSAAVLSRDFRHAWHAARTSSRHRESVAAVTPSSREKSSRDSPRRRRRTASALRLEENRPRSFPDFCFPI